MTRALAGVVGWPVVQSLSPAIHGYWLKEYRIDGAYVALPIEPVRPTRKTRAFTDSGNAKRFQKTRAKRGSHGRTYPEPCRKGRYRLVHQHAEPIHGLMPGSFGLP